MLTLHCNPLSDVKSLSKLYHSFTDQQWPAVLCIATIRAWIEDAPDLLEKLVASPTPTPSGGKRKRDWRARKWQARKDTILDQILKEARNDSALENSTWRYLYLNGNDITPDITPVLILGVTYAEWKATRKGSRQPKDDKNSEDNVDGGDLTNNADDRNSKDNVDNVPKSKLNPEQLFRSWAPAAQKLFHETCKGVKIPVEIAREIKRIHAEETEKRSKGGEHRDDRTPKNPRMESPRELLQPTTMQLPSPTQTPIELVPQRQENPQPQPQQPPSQRVQDRISIWKTQSGHETFPVTAVELNKALETIYTDTEKRISPFYAEKLGPTLESPVRVDKTGKRKGVFSIFLGQTGKNLAKRGDPPATFRDHGFTLSFSQISAHVLELVEKGDKFNLEYYQGVAIAWVPPDYFVVLVGPAYVTVRDAIKRAREEDIVETTLNPGPQ